MTVVIDDARAYFKRCREKFDVIRFALLDSHTQTSSLNNLRLDNFVFTSVFLPTREGGWQGSNRGSFQDSEVDRLHNLALTTVDARQRREYVIALHKRMSETVGVGMLYWPEAIFMARNRLKGPVGEVAEKSGMSWNIFEWEVE